jgi:hypothetical protein
MPPIIHRYGRMGEGARPLERPSPVRRSGAIWLPTRWLMAGDLQGSRTWDKHRLRTGVPLHSDQPAIYGGDTREQLAMESGCEGAANAGSTRSSGRAAGCTCILAPGAATYRAVPADGGRRSVTFRAWLPTREGSPQADQATQIAAHLLPVAMSRMPTGWRGSVFYLVMAHETPGDSRVRALPSPVCTTLAGRQSRRKETVTNRGECPARGRYAGWFASTNVHRLRAAFPTLTRVICCLSAAFAGSRAGWVTPQQAVSVGGDTGLVASAVRAGPPWAEAVSGARRV